MEHKSKNGKVYLIGEVKEYRADKTFDILVILDCENIKDNVEIVGFYFGEYDYEVTENYINLKEND